MENPNIEIPNSKQIRNSNNPNSKLYELSNVSYSYLGKFSALSGINLSVSKGEKIVFLGANGSGKSTLLLVMAGLVSPSKGSVLFMGDPLTEENLADKDFRGFFRKRVGIVFQNSDVQLFNSTVRDEVLFGLVQLGLSKDETPRRLEKYFSLMEIGYLAERHPQYLSIGEKKRVALASVLAMEPEVILLDEPTAGLDPRTTRHLIDTISSLGEKGYTVVMATQDIHVASEISERAVVLGEDKRIAVDRPIREILEDQAFLERHNLVHAHAHRHAGQLHIHPHEHP